MADKQERKTDLSHFMGIGQMIALKSCLEGEESTFFENILTKLRSTIEKMPVTYETDGQGDAAIVTLHYFSSGSDWYIIERDCEVEQLQAFGYAVLNGDLEMAELGYINIEELTRLGVELDLYWQPKPLGEVRKKLQRRAS